MLKKLNPFLSLFLFGILVILNIKYSNSSNQENMVINVFLIFVMGLFFYFKKKQFSQYIKKVKSFKKVILFIAIIMVYLILKYFCYSLYYSTPVNFNLGWFFSSDLTMFFCYILIYILLKDKNPTF